MAVHVQTDLPRAAVTNVTSQPLSWKPVCGDDDVLKALFCDGFVFCFVVVVLTKADILVVKGDQGGIISFNIWKRFYLEAAFWSLKSQLRPSGNVKTVCGVFFGQKMVLKPTSPKLRCNLKPRYLIFWNVGFTFAPTLLPWQPLKPMTSFAVMSLLPWTSICWPAWDDGATWQKCVRSHDQHPGGFVQLRSWNRCFPSWGYSSQTTILESNCFHCHRLDIISSVIPSSSSSSLSSSFLETTSGCYSPLRDNAFELPSGACLAQVQRQIVTVLR